MPQTAPPPVRQLPALALSSATRALRLTAAIVLLAAIVAGGAVLRADRAASPFPRTRPTSAPT